MTATPTTAPTRTAIRSVAREVYERSRGRLDASVKAEVDAAIREVVTATMNVCVPRAQTEDPTLRWEFDGAYGEIQTRAVDRGNAAVEAAIARAAVQAAVELIVTAGVTEIRTPDDVDDEYGELLRLAVGSPAVRAEPTGNVINLMAWLEASVDREHAKRRGSDPAPLR